MKAFVAIVGLVLVILSPTPALPLDCHIAYCITHPGTGSHRPKFKEETKHEQFSCKRKSSWYVPGNV